jgi:hypothetical protein
MFNHACFLEHTAKTFGIELKKDIGECSKQLIDDKVLSLPSFYSLSIGSSNERFTGRRHGAGPAVECQKGEGRSGRDVSLCSRGGRHWSPRNTSRCCHLVEDLSISKDGGAGQGGVIRSGKEGEMLEAAAGMVKGFKV